MKGNFIKGEEKFSLLLKKIYFHCLNHMCLVKKKKEKKHLGNEKYMPEPFKLDFLQEYNQTPLSEKENKLLDRDFGYKNIDELTSMKSAMNCLIRQTIS